MKRGKVVVIGGGLGGLTTAVLLAKNSYEVVVVEKEPHVGGCLQCFSRRGVRFETGMHFIGSAEPWQMLGKMLHFFELDNNLRLSRLDTSGYDVVRFRGTDFCFANGREAFIETFSDYFPAQKDNIARYFDLVRRVASAASLSSLRHAETDAVVDARYRLMATNDAVADCVSNPLLANVLVGNLPLYAGERGKTPFTTHAFTTDFYNQSAFRIVGGSDHIATSLCQTLSRYGGQILCNSQATQIVCDNTHATAVEINDSQRLDTDVVISATHPLRTLELLHTSLIRPSFRQRMLSVPQTIGCFAVYLHFRSQTVPYMNHNLYVYDTTDVWSAMDYDDESWPKCMLYMHFAETENQTFATSGVVLAYMQEREVLRWSDTRVGHRGVDYEEFKRQKAQKLIARLESHCPEICGNIANYYTSTPLTYRDYTGTEGGSMYGVARDVNLGVGGRVPVRTRIPNVFMTGQNVNSHGMQGVIVGTIVTCSELLTAEAIYKQIAL